MTESIKQLSEPGVLEKYVVGGKCVSDALNRTISNITVGMLIVDICKMGDKLMLDNLNEVYKDHPDTGEKTDKGIAIPTCVCLNNMIGYNSPFNDDKTKVREGDMIKLEMGCHIDGYPALVGQTVIINTLKKPITDKRASVYNAVREAATEILSMMVTGNDNIMVASAMEKYAKKYNCNLLTFGLENVLIPGIISYQISKDVINGNNEEDDNDVHNQILARDNPKLSYVQSKSTFVENEVYAIDLAMSTGSGILIDKDTYPNLFQRDFQNFVNLKLNSAKFVLGKFKGKFPINIRDIFNSKLRFGIKDCVSKKLLKPYFIVYEKETEFIAQTKFTVIVKAGKPVLIAATPSQELVPSKDGSGQSPVQ